MQSNQKIHGFIVTRVRPYPDLEANLVEMTHEYSHAKLAWVQRKEQNKTFSIGFRTLPTDSTGVFHILEHSVLEGSEQFPLREPFAELLKSSVNTFLNAMTFPDKTMYPVASRNNQDFINLMRVYLDGVFHPVVLHDRRIFEQEGWHYEFDDNGNAVLQGIVFNEMKGATSNVDDIASEKLTELLFPSTPYRYDSGGNPAVIPTLTYEKFCEAHAKYYHPSNAYLFLDGDIDTDRVLGLLDKELSYAPPRGDVESIPLQKPMGGKATIEYELGADENEENKDRLCTGKLFSTWEETEKVLAAQILCNVLADTNESPLKKAILEQGLAEDVSVELMLDAIQNAICVDYINTGRKQFAELKKTTAAVIEELLKNGLDKDEIRAQLKHYQFISLNLEEPCGVTMAVSIMRSWLYDGDPMLYLQNNEVFASLEAKLETDYFECLLKELFSGDWCEVELYPSKTLGDRLRAEEQKRIAAVTADWDAAKREEIAMKAEALKLWQSTPDSPKALAKLPVLTLDDLRQEPTYIDTRIEEKDGITVLRHPSGKKGIVYLNFYINVPDLEEEDYIRLSTMLQLYGKLPTKKHDVLTLHRLLKMHIGFHYIHASVISTKNGALPMISIQTSLLESEVDTALELLHEILFETDFNNPEKIKPLLLQRIDSLRQSIINSGNYYTQQTAAAHFFPENLLLSYFSGINTYRYLKQFSDHMDEEFPKFLDWTGNAIQRLIGTARLTCGITASETFKTPNLKAVFPEATKAVCDSFTKTSDGAAVQGIIVPSQTSFAALVGDFRKVMPEFQGAMNVMRQILSYEYLWNEIRVKSGAYGAGFLCQIKGLIGGWTYRDPTPNASLNTIANSADFLRQLLETQPNIERFIIGTLSMFDPDLSVSGQGETADRHYFNGLTDEKFLQMRRETLNATAKDLLALCDKLDACLKEHSAICVTGPENALKAIPGIEINRL